MLITAALPSPMSLFALDALYLILADVRGGFGPFLAVYLASVHRWDAAEIGMALSVMGVAGLVCQTPAGALLDATRYKRVVIAAAFALVAAGAMAMVAWPTPPVWSARNSPRDLPAELLAPCRPASSSLNS
jgi:predicted MFS family arabinose efflux permease